MLVSREHSPQDKVAATEFARLHVDLDVVSVDRPLSSGARLLLHVLVHLFQSLQCRFNGAARFLRSSPVLTAIGLASSDKLIDANGESAGEPAIAVRSEGFPILSNMAEFRIVCTNVNRLGHPRNGILNSEHRARKSRSILRFRTSTVPLLQGEYARVNR
jgi:hypothetical protein